MAPLGWWHLTHHPKAFPAGAVTMFDLGKSEVVGLAGNPEQAYDAVGCAERLEMGVYPGGHGFTDEMRSRAYAWLDRWLGS